MRRANPDRPRHVFEQESAWTDCAAPEVQPQIPDACDRPADIYVRASDGGIDVGDSAVVRGVTVRGARGGGRTETPARTSARSVATMGGCPPWQKDKLSSLACECAVSQAAATAPHRVWTTRHRIRSRRGDVYGALGPAGMRLHPAVRAASGAITSVRPAECVRGGVHRQLSPAVPLAKAQVTTQRHRALLVGSPTLAEHATTSSLRAGNM
jgi:hypothetical protein